MQKFEYFEAWNLPVEKDKKYLGFISKSKIFNVYRNLLVEHSREVF
jgi:CIC family chloride channel protein